MINNFIYLPYENQSIYHFNIDEELDILDIYLNNVEKYESIANKKIIL